MCRAPSLDALRVAAAAQPEIGADALPEGAPAQVQALAQEQAANATPGVPPTGLPGDILPLEEVQRQEREGAIRPGMSHAERMAANEAFCRSAEYHANAGSL